MRINQFVARATGLSRRAADEAISAGRVAVNSNQAQAGSQVSQGDLVRLDGRPISVSAAQTIILNKPPGYVCSRRGQGSQTVYELLPAAYHELKPIGRLDKDSSGLLLLTNDGQLANQLTHPSYAKTKVYEVALNKPLNAGLEKSVGQGIELADGPSKLQLAVLDESRRHWCVTMQEGRNRQIRRTFAALGYEVVGLHRTKFGPYALEGLRPGEFRAIKSGP